MTILAINTVGAGCDVAVLRGDGAMFTHAEPMRRGHDTRLPDIVAEAMRLSEIEFSDIERIAVVVGPGSFTGVRVGVAFARGLALALEVPAIGLTSLEAARPAGLTGDSGVILVALPAKTRPPETSWWTQAMDSDGPLGPPEELDDAAVRNKITALDAAMIVTSLGAPFDGLGARVVQGAPQAEMAAKLARALKDVSSHPPIPAYVREPDAVPMTPIARPTE